MAEEITSWASPDPVALVDTGLCSNCDAVVALVPDGPPDRPVISYHERPPRNADEHDDGIGARPCGGSYQRPRFL